MTDDAEIATLQFREQMDGRKVSRLPGGKVVLIDLASLAEVHDGEWWLVRLRQRDTFAVATPIEKVKAPLPRPSGAATPAPAPTSAPLPAASHHPAQAPERPRPLAAFEIGGMLIEPHDIIRNQERIAFFVDGANMDGAARSAGYFIDFRKAVDFFLGPGTFYAGFYYVADFTAQDPYQVKFLDALSYAGFIIRRKPVKAITDAETGERVIKGNLDTEIVLDMLNTVANYDVAFLFSGDSDFERAIDLLRSKGKRVYIVSSRRSVSRELAYVADKPVFFIEDFRAQLEKGQGAGALASADAAPRTDSQRL